MSSIKLFVGGLPRDTSSQQFTELFASFGEIENAAVIRVRRSILCPF